MYHSNNRKKLKTPIVYLKGVGPAKAESLGKELHIFSYEDLLTYYPFRYFDKTKFYTINEINTEEVFIQVKGVITQFQLINTGKVKRLVATLKDPTGSVELVWFQGIAWVQKTLQINTEYIIFGKPTLFNNRYNFSHPEVESIHPEEEKKASHFSPVYYSTEKLKHRGFDTKGIARITKQLFSELQLVDVEEFLPVSLIAKYKLVSRYDALLNIHFPSDEALMQQAMRRLKFEELFITQLKILQLKVGRNESVKGYLFEKLDIHFNTFYHEKLSFKLTEAQQRVLKEIRRDTLSGKQMNRLLQGDVGSGKTIVALITTLIAKDNHFQSAVMAPTEILANQHYETFKSMLDGMPVSVKLLTGSVKGKARKIILEELAEGKIDILIGTHALIENHVIFQNLGMVVIDEQHRFGVGQRAKLWQKNEHAPHILVMTATPIPRTLAMTIYGDLDVSVIDQLPPGRKPIQTLHRFDSQRLAVFGFMKKEIALGRQIYIVYPLIEESEKLDYKDLMDGYESIVREFPMPEYHVSILHGKMKPKDKDFEMARFMRGETQIMVATTVIEVGVNVPNASVMIIESAERFGLSQLHQLRGRVGRGADQSYCILLSGVKISHESRQRLKIMCESNDGFEIAEFDLTLRGPGAIDGTQQSGATALKIADITKDKQLLQMARDDAKEILALDQRLVLPEHQQLRNYILDTSSQKTIWSKIS